MMITVMEPEPRVVAIADRIERVFVDMPGLLLTAGQVRRLLDVPRPQCEAALCYLVEMRHLVIEDNGQYRLRFSTMPLDVREASRPHATGSGRAPGGAPGS